VCQLIEGVLFPPPVSFSRACWRINTTWCACFLLWVCVCVCVFVCACMKRWTSPTSSCLWAKHWWATTASTNWTCKEKKRYNIRSLIVRVTWRVRWNEPVTTFDASITALVQLFHVHILYQLPQPFPFVRITTNKSNTGSTRLWQLTCRLARSPVLTALCSPNSTLLMTRYAKLRVLIL